MKLFLTRWFLLQKRLFKMPVFLLILCMVPLMVLALRLTAAQSDGFVDITIVMEDPSDASAQKLCDKLTDSSHIIRITVLDDVGKAEDRVRYGETDAAWIISGDLDEAIDSFVGEGRRKACVTVIEREESVALCLSREKLSAALSPEFCFELMRSSYEQKVGGDLTDAELRQRFDDAFSVDELFVFQRTTGETMDDTSSYLMLPIRGMLAVAVLLCGFAMALFWLVDEKRMVFCRISGRTRPLFELGYHLTGIVDIAIIMLISLYAAGLGTSFLREVAALLIYALNCAVFVILVRRLLRKSGFLAAVAPLILLLVIAVNPIIFNLPSVYPIRVLTPVYYYLQATHDVMFLVYGLLYFVAVAVLDWLLYGLSTGFRRKRSGSVDKQN